MVDCPAILHSGADLIVSLSIFLRAPAFKSPSTSATPHSLPGDNRKASMMFNEGQETYEEQILRERKSSLLKLFDVVGLKPKTGVDVLQRGGRSESEVDGNASNTVTQASKPKRISTKVEIVGDGEEVEVEEGEDLSENELNMIYKKYALEIASKTMLIFLSVNRAQKNDRVMGEMQPPETFTLTLRGYQKQALL